MKKILKFLLVPVFVSSTTLTVVACGTNEQISNQDIINLATGRMQNHMFNMNNDLGLTKIPDDQSSYNSLSGTVRQRITSYYSNLVQPGLNWDYPGVNVSVTTDSDSTPSTFITKYGSNVESRINLTAHLAYKNLTAKTDIIVKINNDKTTQQEKIDAIGSYLTKYLDTNPVFSFKTLFKDGLKSTDPEAAYADGQIQASLRNNLFITTTTENPIPIIDVAGVDLSVQRPTSEATIYTLDNDAMSDKKQVQGSLENLTLTLGYESGGFHTSIEGKTLKIAQTFNDTNNQVATILNQGSEGLQFNKADLVAGKLPEENQMLDKYDPDNSFRDKVAEKIFNFISLVYPTAKMKGSDTWDASKVTIDNAASTSYIKENEKYGYFIVNVKFSFKVDNSNPDKPVVIETLVSNLKLNLNDL